METREHPNRPAHNFDLATAFELYNKNLIGYAEGALKKYGVKNYKTIAPDIVQNAYLQLQSLDKPIPQTKTELIKFLSVCVFSESEHYVRLKAATDSKHPRSNKIRESHLTDLSEAENITVPPQQEKMDSLAGMINSVSNITKIQKEILIAHYVEGKTLDEIAPEMGLESREQVKDRLYKAQEKLKTNPKFKNLSL